MNLIYVVRDICPNGYLFKHQPGITGIGGGVGLLYINTLRLDKSDATSFKSFESIETNLRSNSMSTRLIYRPSSSSLSLFFDEFSSLLEHVCILPGNVITIGDFNIRADIPDYSAARKFNDLLGIFNLKKHVASSTHKNRHTLDLIITRCNDLSVSNVSVVDPGISDHCALLFNLSVSKPPLPRNRGYYMAARGYEFYLRVLKVSLTSERSERVRDTFSTRR